LDQLIGDGYELTLPNLLGLEHIIGTSRNDRLTGNANDNELSGASADSSST
jgi:hypothetical protein